MIELLDWIAVNEATLSGIAATLAIVGVVSALGLRAFNLLRRKPSPIKTSIAAAPAVDSAQISPKASISSAKPSVAVLPFLNLSDDRDKDYFADGLTEDILTRLSLARHLSVKSRSSTFGYKGQSPDVREVGRNLDVSYVVEGSIRPIADRVRITVQLIAAQSGDHLWARNYDRAAADLFEVQDDVIASITSALGANLTKAESARARSVRPGSLSAWEAVQRASFYRGAAGNSEEETNESIDELRRAALEEPDYAYPHSMLAWILQYRVVNGLTDDPATDRAEVTTHLETGLALAPDDPFNLNICSGAVGYTGDWQKSVDLCNRALSIDPHFADIYFNLGLAYSYLGRFDDAEEALNRVEQMAPGGPMSRYYDWYRSLLRSLQGRHDEAAQLQRSTIDQSPMYTTPYIALTLSLLELGKADEAREILARVRKINPRLNAKRVEIHARAHNIPEDGQRRFEMLQALWR